MLQRTSDYKINQTTFRVAYGDITKIVADVLVSSDDNYLSMGGGVSRALRNAGGDIIWQDAQKHLPLNIADVVVTSAGELSAKYLFHVVTIDSDKMIDVDKDHLHASVLKCMELGDALGLKHVVFPALGTGAGHFPFQTAAEIMTRTIADYLNQNTAIEMVTMALFSQTKLAENSIDMFYERAVALASVSAQSKRLNTLLSELQEIIGPIQDTDLSERLTHLQDELFKAQTMLEKSSNSPEEMDNLEAECGIAEMSRHAVELTEETLARDNKELEANVLRTQLSGLLTQLNIHYSNLNKLQIKEAKYGIDVPLHLENAIEDTQADINEIELKVQATRKQLTELGVDD